jgi:hypothetical protein
VRAGIGIGGVVTRVAGDKMQTKKGRGEVSYPAKRRRWWYVWVEGYLSLSLSDASLMLAIAPPSAPTFAFASASTPGSTAAAPAAARRASPPLLDRRLPPWLGA